MFFSGGNDPKNVPRGARPCVNTIAGALNVQDGRRATSRWRQGKGSRYRWGFLWFAALQTLTRRSWPVSVTSNWCLQPWRYTSWEASWDGRRMGRWCQASEANQVAGETMDTADIRYRCHPTPVRNKCTSWKSWPWTGGQAQAVSR
jgi:hypothetical protein